MENAIINMLLFLCTLYLGLIVIFTLGLFRTCAAQMQNDLTVSILVAAKNEAANIEACLASLTAQRYPVDQFEIVVINDQSTDDTAHKISTWANRTSNVHLCTVTERRYACPKKNALWHGIQQATGEIIITTDADCHPGPNWVATITRYFGLETGMVIGPAPLKTTGGLWGHLLSLQGLAVAALAMGSSGVKFPLTCSGRNLAYRKSVFEEVGGFNRMGHITGGDDVLLMRRIAKTRWRICYTHHPEASVPSSVHTDHILNRQIRYQSKAIHYTPFILLLALAVYTFHLILFLYPPIIWTYPSALLAMGGTLLLKVSADGVFLWLAAHRLSTQMRPTAFVVFEILLIPYVAVICALGALIPSRWK